MPDLVECDNINQMIKITVITLSGGHCIIKTTKIDILEDFTCKCPLHSKTKFDIEVKLIDTNENENIFFLLMLTDKTNRQFKNSFLTGSMLK